MCNGATLTHVGEQNLVNGMGKLGEGHVSLLHVPVQVTDGSGDTPLLSLQTSSFKESCPVSFETVDIPVGLNREVLENLPLFKLSEESMVDDAFVDDIEAEKLVDEFVIDEVAENPPGDHLEGKDGDEFLGFDCQLVFLLVPDDMGEMRQRLEPFVGVADHDGEEFRGFLRGKVGVDVCPKTTPILIMLHADGLTENSAHVFSKPNIWDFEMDLCVTVVISANIVGIGQNAWN